MYNAIFTLTYLVFCFSDKVLYLLSSDIMNVVSRIMGLMITVMGIQLFIIGIKAAAFLRF
ncbi:MAG: hypothetical protein KTR26_15755 [Flammeovirgaceae bacterium]|nr:hypothetical protein [Flammeovirgaceae bacterium]